MARQQATFSDDLASSLAAWRTAPALPLLTVALGLVVELADLLGPASVLLSLPAGLLLLAWFGTQRVWYLRIFREKRLEPTELWPMTWAFAGRYVMFGILAGGAISIVVIALTPATDSETSRALLVVPFVFVGDFVATFVTPALAFSTRHVPEALSIGWRTLWGGWPATAPYAVVAPLVILGVGQGLSQTLGPAGSIAVSLFGLLVALLFKGATAAYYLREHDAGDNGAAFDR